MADQSAKQLRDKRLIVLLSILSLEAKWAYYSLSSGNLYIKETKEATIQYFQSLEELQKLDNEILNPRGKISDPDIQAIREIIGSLKAWSKDGSDLNQPWVRIRAMLFLYLFSEQKAYLIKALKLSWYPSASLSSQEFENTSDYLRWAPHLPRTSMISLAYEKGLDISRVGTSKTIVVYGDIRRSQDLMIYTEGNDRFEERMVRFTDSIRNLLHDNVGVFDKFTGDGFLAYFNEYLCALESRDYVDCFIQFCRECMKTSQALFDEWKRCVRKLPEEEIMVSIGADVGDIYFGMQYGHLVCIGNAIVWAQRMCSAASAGDVYVNNMLGNLLKEREGIVLTPEQVKTKTGEGFTAFNVILTQS